MQQEPVKITKSQKPGTIFEPFELGKGSGFFIDFLGKSLRSGSLREAYFQGKSASSLWKTAKS